MGTLCGTTFDRYGKPLGGVKVEVKDCHFQTQFSTESGPDGAYCLSVPDGIWPFITAVRDYGEKYLEFWCQNLIVSDRTKLDAHIDTLEIYGMHMFRVKGAGPQFLLYFRPMELERFKRGEKDICPVIDQITVVIDGEKAELLHIDRVTEAAGGMKMGAYLLQLAAPRQNTDWYRWGKVCMLVSDAEGHTGEAVLYPERDTV